MATRNTVVTGMEAGSGSLPKPITPTQDNRPIAANPARVRVEQAFLWGLEPGGGNLHMANSRRRRSMSKTQVKPIIFF